MNDPYEPLNPEDIGLLVGLAGPVYAESKMIDAMTGVKPTTGGGYAIEGAETIKRGLENIVQAAVRTPTPPSFQPPPQYIQPPQVPQIPIQQFVPTPAPVIDYGYEEPSTSPQLEFDFSLTEQKITNNWLEKIDKKLQKLITLLESKNTNEPIKLEPPVKGLQTVSKKPSQAQ